MTKISIEGARMGLGQDGLNVGWQSQDAMWKYKLRIFTSRVLSYCRLIKHCIKYWMTKNVDWTCCANGNTKYEQKSIEDTCVRIGLVEYWVTRLPSTNKHRISKVAKNPVHSKGLLIFEKCWWQWWSCFLLVRLLLSTDQAVPLLGLLSSTQQMKTVEASAY